MKYLAIYRPSAPEGTRPTAEHIEEMGKLITEMTESGILLATEGCLPSSRGVRVRRRNGEIIVTDGPFTESKELVAGFALFRVNSKEEAIAWTKRFLSVAGDGESEIREIAEYEPGADAATAGCLEAEQAGGELAAAG